MPMRFKVTPSTNQRLIDAGLSPPVDASIDRLSTLLDQVENHVLDLYVQERDQEAIEAATALKDFAVGVRYKAAPGMASVELPMELADALAQARNNEGDARITALLRHVAGTQVAVSAGGKLTDSGDQSKMPSKAKQAPVDAPQSAYEALVKDLPLSTVSTTKAAPVDAIAAAIQGDLRSDMRPR